MHSKYKIQLPKLKHPLWQDFCFPLEFFTNSQQYKNANIANFRFSCAIRNEEDHVVQSATSKSNPLVSNNI